MALRDKFVLAATFTCLAIAVISGRMLFFGGDRLDLTEEALAPFKVPPLSQTLVEKATDAALAFLSEDLRLLDRGITIDLWTLQVEARDNCSQAVGLLGELMGGVALFRSDGEGLLLSDLARACAVRTYTEWINWVYLELGMRHMKTRAGLLDTLGCTQETTRCNYRAASCGYDIPPCDVDHLMEMLKVVQVGLNKLEEKYEDFEWTLFAGGLLGAVRDKGHIPHETDIDIAISADGRGVKALREFRTELKKHKATDDYSVYVYSKAEDQALYPMILYYSGKNKLHIDMWVYERNEDEKRIEMVSEGRFKPTWKFPFKEWYPIQRNCTYGPLTGLPCVYDTGATLTRMYGPGWKQPSRKLERSSLHDPQKCISYVEGAKYYNALEDGLPRKK